MMVWFKVLALWPLAWTYAGLLGLASLIEAGGDWLDDPKAPERGIVLPVLASFLLIGAVLVTISGCGYRIIKKTDIDGIAGTLQACDKGLDESMVVIKEVDLAMKSCLSRYAAVKVDLSHCYKQLSPVRSIPRGAPADYCPEDLGCYRAKNGCNCPKQQNVPGLR